MYDVHNKLYIYLYVCVCISKKRIDTNSTKFEDSKVYRLKKLTG